MNKRILISIAMVLALVLIVNSGTLQGLDGVPFEPELLAALPPLGSLKIQHFDAIHVLADSPHEILFVTRNQGAYCGGGTPATVWKMTLAPDTGDVISVDLKQSLPLIQSVRGALFESSEGTLFTGGGWCLYKPPYFSTDRGETWQPANRGVHPPNSTFSYVEFKDEVYAGTGYAPYHGQVYRWLGDQGSDHWQLVLDVAPPRTVVNSMAVHDDRLFVSSWIYGYGDPACHSSVPVYVSTDGQTFNATTGIPPCFSVNWLLLVGDQLVAQVFDPFDRTDIRLYRWDDGLAQWTEIGPFPLCPSELNNDRCVLLSLGTVMYGSGQAPGDAQAGVYRSSDLGETWQQIAVLEDPDIARMTSYDQTLYLGTWADANDTAYIYRIRLFIEADVDIKPGSFPNVINPRSKGVIPVAILTTDALDATTVDPLSVAFGPAGAIETHGRGHIEDVDGDGDLDLMLHFRTQETGIQCGDASATLVGETLSGQPIEGSDSVRTAGCQ